jgi:2-polyprenyl-3-methyl-5-hydroxy-6-metoxy-1,4-benzoquinol methylase
MKDKLLQVRSLIDEILVDIDNKVGSSIKIDEFETLKRLLNSPEWPAAVLPFQVADENSESDKEERAEGISDILLPPLANKRFLDFGCGEGHVAHFVSKTALTSVGYDLKKTGSRFVWEQKEGNLLLTSNFDSVVAEGPYDIILIYDVLDHSESSMSELLSKAKSVLSDDGKIILRCHPWSARHGGHLYRKINKAFVHLVFTESELDEMGLRPEHNLRITYPINTYKEAIKKSGLNEAATVEIDTQEIENFFKEDALVRSRILKAFGIKEWTENPPAFQMSLCFVDYVLKK